MSDGVDVVVTLHALATYAERANHWTDDKRMMDASGVADTIYEAADRIEELEERLKAVTEDAKEAEAYAGELEANLAKAVEALQGLVPILCEGFEDGCGKLSRDDCAACEGYATLAELTGGKNE